MNAPRHRAAPHAVRVLYVEDDIDERIAGRVLLGAAGFTVMTAVNAADAVRLFYASAVDVVVTNIRMPGEGGVALIRDLRRLRPAVPIVAISGGGVLHDLSVLDAAEALGVETLEKPFMAGDLVAAIQRVLEQAR